MVRGKVVHPAAIYQAILLPPINLCAYLATIKPSKNPGAVNKYNTGPSPIKSLIVASKRTSVVMLSPNDCTSANTICVETIQTSRVAVIVVKIKSAMVLSIH